MKATVFAPTNIALAKYWGKRDVELNAELNAGLNLPSNGSISVTLDKFGSTTTATIDATLNDDVFELNGIAVTDINALKKVKRVLDLLRAKSDVNNFFKIESTNNFPTGAGLASSASGFCALTLAASRAVGADDTLDELNIISRQGSGSSCRSFYGGFVEWNQGVLANGTDCKAVQLHDHEHWPLSILIAVVSEEKKYTPSTDGMLLTQTTSPYFSSWTTYAQNSLSAFRLAIKTRNFSVLTGLAEENCIRMHAAAMAASIIYWKPQTLQIIDSIRRARTNGLNAFFTIDAGPNVVLFCEPSSTAELKAELANIGVKTVLESKIGAGVQVR